MHYTVNSYKFQDPSETARSGERRKYDEQVVETDRSCSRSIGNYLRAIDTRKARELSTRQNRENDPELRRSLSNTAPPSSREIKIKHKKKKEKKTQWERKTKYDSTKLQDPRARFSSKGTSLESFSHRHRSAPCCFQRSYETTVRKLIEKRKERLKNGSISRSGR